MANFESQDAATSSPTRYSAKLDSLLNFLEEHSEQKDDNRDKLSNDDARRGTGAFTSHIARHGLADITNCRSPPQNGAPEGKKALTGQNKEEGKDIRDRIDARSEVPKPLVMSGKKKKYIWDDWEETALLTHLDDQCERREVRVKVADKMPSGDDVEESSSCMHSNGLPANAHKQLQELKSMSQEIQTRASAMKIEMEHKKKRVEELHSIRVQNESDHVQKMTSIKQVWKDRLEVAKTEHNRFMDDQEKRRETLRKDCVSLEKKMLSVQADMDRTLKSEQEIYERLKRDGTQELEDARKSWSQSERDELKKRDHKMSPKLKRDAAKAVEPKLRQLMERNKEEIERLERDAARELDCYKLELYKQSNEGYKKETNKIRSEERKRIEMLENDWIAKMESSRREHEDEMNKVRREHEERAMFVKRQFNADKQRITDEQEVTLEDAQKASTFEMEQVRIRYKREMTAIENNFSEKMADKQKSCHEELKQWKAGREIELLAEEEIKIKDEHMRMRDKFQSDVDMVKQKLREERIEKRQEMELDKAEKEKATRAKYDSETRRLEDNLQQAKREVTMLQQKQTEESCQVNNLQSKLSILKDSIQQKEDQPLIQQQRLVAFNKESEQQIIEIQNDGERRVAQAMTQKAMLEKELDKLIADLPSAIDLRNKEREDLESINAEEIVLAEGKIRSMIEKKKSMLEAASTKLLHLRQDAARVEKELDAARKATLAKCAK